MISFDESFSEKFGISFRVSGFLISYQEKVNPFTSKIKWSTGVPDADKTSAPDFLGVVDFAFSIKIPKASRGIIIMENKNIFFISDIILRKGDFLKLSLSKADLIVTSPPYNIGIDYGIYDDRKTYKEYLDFSKAWLAKCFEILMAGGRICVNVPIDIQGHSLSADLTILAKRAGFKYKGTIIWNPSAALGASKHSMVFSRNIELILIFYKDGWKPVKAEFKEWVNEIWQFSGESKKRVGHPAPFPVEIPRRLMKMFSDPHDIVLDPFSGSGSTMVACMLCGRKGIGVEIDEKYVKASIDRLKNKKW